MQKIDAIVDNFCFLSGSPPSPTSTGLTLDFDFDSVSCVDRSLSYNKPQLSLDKSLSVTDESTEPSGLTLNVTSESTCELPYLP